MCGIAGIVSTNGRHPPPEIELLRSMVGAIRHRGPDEYGLYRDERAGLVHARLSFVDLVTGQQPLANADGTLWIIFNGEIFNYVELRRELEGLGHTFRTHSDTEVIVHAYEAWGNRCFTKFNGQWAFALWDSKRKRLVLSRDRIGVRPLYIHEKDGLVHFASEVKALFADPTLRRAIDPRGLEQTFTYWASQPPTTLFEGVEELPPGTVRTYDADGRKDEVTFWTPSYPEAGAPYPLSLAEATEVLREKLTLATQMRVLRADVPIGSYLSGGLDSSLIAGMGRKAKEGVFKTFSLRFEDAEFDETNFQRMMASTIDSDHSEIVVRRSDIALVFPEVILHAERPILRTAPAPLYLLSQSVRRGGIKGVLTGEGADEMLAGYDLFREAKIRMFWSRQPGSKVRPRLFDRLYPYLARSPQMARGMAMEFWRQGLEKAGSPGFSHDPRWRTTSALKRFLSSAVTNELTRKPAPDILEYLPADFRRWDDLSQAQFLEVTTLLSSYLISSQGDRMLMAHSVEGRFPFLDSDVMEFCNGLPPEYKLAGLHEKHILKLAARGQVPEPIINRQKQPYRAPDAVSFLGPEAPSYVSELLSEDALRQSGLFDVQAVRGLYAKCSSRVKATGGSEPFSNTDNMSFVGLLSGQLTWHHFIREPGSGRGNGIHFTTHIDRAAVAAH
ncbi:MAG TPA: asparagine synthase (glutamine-hydrolyzing) [Bacteroidota bacterium]|nr:asparagine synthase (glutamine-hydrolyzing) [Bacteroidota bacterium]